MNLLEETVMTEPPLISFVVPVYNRPGEVDELLQSMTEQRDLRFEVVLVEDGSSLPCDDVMAKYLGQLSITYLVIPNGGPGGARNVGAEAAKSDLVVFLDSDVVLPRDYVSVVNSAIAGHAVEGTPIDVFGGPDKAHENFSPVQKAINYSMTSFLTTGGIRGRKLHVGRYYPRTFNMGCSKAFFGKVNGFDASMRFGEDIDFGLRLYKAGANVVLLGDAWVYHKRRVDFRKFYKQVYNSGVARIHLTKRHKGSLKLVHLLPSIATFAFLGLLFCGLICLWSYTLFIPIALIFFLDALRSTRSVHVALLALPASFIQITGYGIGFGVASWRRIILRSPEFSSFKNTFYD